jgi:hypothetical protein
MNRVGQSESAQRKPSAKLRPVGQGPVNERSRSTANPRTGRAMDPKNLPRHLPTTGNGGESETEKRKSIRNSKQVKKDVEKLSLEAASG